MDKIASCLLNRKVLTVHILVPQFIQSQPANLPSLLEIWKLEIIKCANDAPNKQTNDFNVILPNYKRYTIYQISASAYCTNVIPGWNRLFKDTLTSHYCLTVCYSTNSKLPFTSNLSFLSLSFFLSQFFKNSSNFQTIRTQSESTASVLSSLNNMVIQWKLYVIRSPRSSVCSFWFVFCSHIKPSLVLKFHWIDDLEVIL